jgi:signal peptidase I
MLFLRKIYLFFVDIVQTLLIAASIFLVIYIFLFRPFQVNGASMYPTFHDKEYVLTNLIALRLEELHQGDVVVFKAPGIDNDKDFIKRIIGVAGDTVAIKNGEVYVNDSRLDESAYLSPDVKTYPGSFMKEGESVTVPPTSYLVMGDNRPHSSDSREWGFITKDAIIGKSMFVYWPPNRMRMVKNPFSL